MKKILKAMLYLIIAIALIVGIFIYFLSNSEKVGAYAQGDRLKRMELTETFREGVYHNIEYTPSLKEGVSMFQVLRSFLFEKDKRNRPSKPLPVIKTDLKNISKEEDYLIWFGHSSYLLQVDNKRILIDPVFSKNASPLPYSVKAFDMSYDYDLDNFPDIDILLITHDHWDHLDFPSILKLKNRVKTIVTSLGVGAHFERWGFDSETIKELYWGESLQIDSLNFTACPTRHFSGRWIKRNTSLWSSFVLKSKEYNLFLGGDSGYGKHFKDIGNKYGPFDLAILENGQYNEYWHNIHMMPEEVVQAAGDLKTKVILPVHSSKFPLANHAWDEPLIRVSKEAKRLNFPIWTPQIGQITYLNKENTFKHWWEGVD